MLLQLLVCIHLWLTDTRRLHALTPHLSKRVGALSQSDPVISQAGVAAFIQSVLVPEVAVRLIAQDMDVGIRPARDILEESRELGEKLNGAEKEGDIYHEGEDSGWVDVNATPAPEEVEGKEAGRVTRKRGKAGRS